MLSLDPPLAVVADVKGNITAWHLQLPPSALEAAGQFVEAAAAYAHQGELARAAELFQPHGQPYQAAQLWEATGQLEPAAEQYELAERWLQAAQLWQRLERPRRQAEGLVNHARSLANAGVGPKLEAEAWAKAVRLFQAVRDFEQATACRKELARCHSWPVFEIKVQPPPEGLVLESYSLVEFTVRNTGYGLARQLTISVDNKEMFAGALAHTRQIMTLPPDHAWTEQLDVQPSQAGTSVPLQLRLSYRDDQEQSQNEDHRIHLRVARTEAERRPSRVININSGGGTVMFDSTVAAGGDFVGRDQTTQLKAAERVKDKQIEENIKRQGAMMSSEEKPQGSRSIDTGGGAYVEGRVDTGGGDFVGRDQVKTTGMTAAEAAKLFETIYQKIEAHPDLSDDDKADLKAEVEEVQAEVAKPEAELDESFLSRRLRNIQRMAPDILQVVTATLTNPAAGFALVVQKIAGKMNESAAHSGQE